jgi:hypothetical protein
MEKLVHPENKVFGYVVTDSPRKYIPFRPTDRPTPGGGGGDTRIDRPIKYENT